MSTSEVGTASNEVMSMDGTSTSEYGTSYESGSMDGMSTQDTGITSGVVVSITSTTEFSSWWDSLTDSVLSSQSLLSADEKQSYLVGCIADRHNIILVCADQLYMRYGICRCL